MTPQDHNKTLGIIYGFLGGILTLAALVELIRVIMLERELERIGTDSTLLALIIVGLLLTIILLSTAYGLIKRRRWARIPALLLSALLVWLFPLGTALAIYSWWFLHSAGYRRISSDSADQQ